MSSGSKSVGTLFLNRRSGTAEDERADAIRAACDREGLDVVEITPDVDIKAVVKGGISRGQSLFIAGGGDGTIHHVSQAVIGTEARLGILPIGTINHLAKDLHLPLEWEEALQIALHGRITEVDVGSVNGVYFTNVMMLGLFPDLVRQREDLRHWYGKTIAYSTSLIGSLRRLRTVTLNIQTEQRSEIVKTPVFAVAVNRYDFDAPGVVAPKVSFVDGQLAVYWSPSGERWYLLKLLARFISGTLVLGRHMRTLNTRELLVKSTQSRMRIVMNGELVTMNTPLQIRIHPRALRIVTPETQQTPPGGD